MPLKYLLPCQCGQRLTIEPRQAGEIVLCECGQSLEVPPLLQLRQLEKVVQEDDSPRFAWGHGQQMILLGIIVFLCCAGLAIYLLFFIGPPQNPLSGKPPEIIHEMVQKLTPLESWQMWIIFRTQGINPQKDWAKRHYLEKLAAYKILWILLVPVFFVGAAFIAAGIVIFHLKRKRRAGAVRASP